MATLNDLIFEAESTIDYDLDRSPAKCRAHIKALRKLIFRKPKSVAIDGNTVSFEEIKDMLAKAESWFSANDDSDNGINGSRNRIYDMSGIRDR